MLVVKIKQKINLVLENVIKGVEVTGFKRGSNSKAVTGVETNKGTIECEQVIANILL